MKSVSFSRHTSHSTCTPNTYFFPCTLTALPAMNWSFGAFFAIVINMCNMKIFMDPPNDTLVGTFIFLLTLTALIHRTCSDILPTSVPFAIQLLVSTLLSEYAFELSQTTFWMPLERAVINMTYIIYKWTDQRCLNGWGRSWCMTSEVIDKIAMSGLLQATTALLILLGTLHVIQAPYAAFLWRAKKKAWRAPRAPTPFPFTKHGLYSPMDEVEVGASHPHNYSFDSQLNSRVGVSETIEEELDAVRERMTTPEPRMPPRGTPPTADIRQETKSEEHRESGDAKSNGSCVLCRECVTKMSKGRKSRGGNSLSRRS